MSSFTQSAINDTVYTISILSAKLENHKKQLETMNAFKNGSKIQIRSIGCKHWSDNENPGWDFRCYEYRIKPTPIMRACKTFDEAKQFLDCEIIWANEDKPIVKNIDCVGNNKFKINAHWTPVSFMYMFDNYVRYPNREKIGVEEIPE